MQLGRHMCAAPMNISAVLFHAARAFIALSAVITLGAVSAFRKRMLEIFQHRSSHLVSSSSPARPPVYSCVNSFIKDIHMCMIWFLIHRGYLGMEFNFVFV